MLAVLLLGQCMCVIDVFVVNVAMPSIARDLHASGASLQLVVGGYTIAYAMLLIIGARLGDRYGRRRTYLAGVIVFTAASLACALAPDSEVLVGFRFVQGAGAAVLVPQVFSIIQLAFTGVARARALSAYAVVLSAGAVAGLVLGGIVVTANLFGTSWRPVFAINVPIGIVLAVLVPRLVPADAPRANQGAAPGLDLAGLAAAVSAVLLIVLPLVLGHEAGWPAWCFGCIAAGVRGGAGALTWVALAGTGLGLGLSVSPLLTQSLVHVPAARAADASGLLTTTVQLGQLLGVAVIGSVYLSRSPAHASAAHASAANAHAARALASAQAMSGTAAWLAALSAAGLLAAVLMARAARGRSRARASLSRRPSASN